ncbi:anaphase-promoting complex subunit 5-like [Oncorhynchus clarkii lewisi]|uniref:anaphase-promoting complex subunit 5-like n=1 Tax=Oncorhynchus clarkii lewisi TaxID=490388 RepID=UPI0039B90F40
MDKGRALLLPARCQVATAGSQPSGQRHAGLGLAMQTLVEAVAYFSMLDCKGRLWDIHYLQARLHHTLGQTPQCNKCAKLFHLLELQAQGAAVAMRL